MARTLTSTQQTNVTAAATRPIFLVKWTHSGATEYLSCSGSVTFDGQAYTAGGINIRQVEDSNTATLMLPATSTRIGEVTSGSWRGGTCVIYAIAAAPGDTPTYSASDGITVLDGIIESSKFANEQITVVAKNKYFIGALCPRYLVNDVSSQVPAVGSTFEFDGEVYNYEQWLATNTQIQRLVRPGTNPQFRGRPTTTDVNSFNVIPKTGYQPITGEGTYIPVIYGRASVPGYIFADGTYGSAKIIGVIWCMGEVFSVEEAYINDVKVREYGTGVLAYHYRGTTNQTVDPYLQAFVASSPQFDEDLVLDTYQGSIGICYSVFLINQSVITGPPQFRAVIQGRLVEDPDGDGTADPFYDYTAWSFDFLSTGTTDQGPNGVTLSLSGDASISSPSIGLELDGTGDYASIADSPSYEVTTEPFTLEVIATPSSISPSPTTVETLISKDLGASPAGSCLRVDKIGNELYLYLSSNGEDWDIAGGAGSSPVIKSQIVLTESGSPITPDQFSLVLEHNEHIFTMYLNGQAAVAVRTPVTSPLTTNGLFDSGAPWEIGATQGTQEWTGSIQSARLTIGAYRYGGPHTATTTPFDDSGSYQANYVYSDKPALAWSDLAQNAFFGLNATVTGVSETVAYGDELMDCGEARCRIGLAITDPRRVEQHLDNLAMYANALWFPEGSDLKIIPDRVGGADNSTGFNIVTTTDPITGGSPSGYNETLTTDNGATYSVSYDLTTSTTSPLTGVTVYCGPGGSPQVECIANQKATGTYTGTFTATGSDVIELAVDAGFNGTVENLSVTRVFYKITEILAR